MRSIRFTPDKASLALLRAGMPPVILLLLYIFYRLHGADETTLLPRLRECRVMLEYALMSLAILAAGAAAFEKAAQMRR